MATTPASGLDQPLGGRGGGNAAPPVWRFDTGNGVVDTVPSVRRMMGDVPVFMYELGPGSGKRLPSIRPSADTEFYAVALVLEGDAECESPSSRFRLGAGEIATWNSQEVTSFHVDRGIRKVSWFFPLSRMNSALPATITRVGRHFRKNSALTSLLAGHFTNIIANGDFLQYHQLQYLARMSLDVVANTLLAAEAGPLSSPTQQLNLDILEFIDSRLKDPDLSSDQIAGAFNISRRYLDMLFVANSVTVSAWIRSQRLKRCRAELQMPSSNRTVSEIAMKWGFADSSHFSRIFRREFGCSPSDVRLSSG